MQTVKHIFQKWNNISLVRRIICGLIAGILLGLAVPQASGLSILGDLFIGALRGIAPVLVFFLVMSSLCHMEKGQKTNMTMIVILYMIGNIAAAACAVIASFLFPVSLPLSQQVSAGDAAAPGGMTEVLTNLLMNGATTLKIKKAPFATNNAIVIVSTSLTSLLISKVHWIHIEELTYFN